MFVLIWSDNGILDGSEKVRVYKTHEEAYVVMAREFTEWYVDTYELGSEDNIGKKDLSNDIYDGGEFDLNYDEAYDGTDMESAEWRIYEVKE